MKKKIIILIIVIFVLILGVGGFFYLWQGQMAQKSKEIEKKEEVTEEKIIETFGDIVVKETPEGKIVENKKESISMKVPEGWEVNTHTSEDVVLQIRKFGPNQTLDTELQDGMVLNLYIQDNPERLNIKEFALKNWEYSPEELISLKINGKGVIKTIEKVIYGLDEYDENPVYLEDSELVDLSFTKDDKTYTLSCSSAGPNYKDYTKECEDVMKDKIQNEF